MKENNYEVLVGNIGTVHTGEWEDTARQDKYTQAKARYIGRENSNSVEATFL